MTRVGPVKEQFDEAADWVAQSLKLRDCGSLGLLYRAYGLEFRVWRSGYGAWRFFEV